MTEHRRSSCERKGSWYDRGAMAVLISVTLVLLLGGPTWATPTEPEDHAAFHGFAGDDLGYLLFDPTTGAVIAARQADVLRIPASTAKAVSTLAALEILGANYRFTTSVLISGRVVGGTLDGNLYLRGGGDPTLATEHLQEFVRALQQAGITKITGQFVFDDSFLALASQIDERQPVAATYNPGLSALSLNYNRVQLRWQKQSDSRLTTIVRSPAAAGAVPVEAITTGLLPPRLDRRIKFLNDGGLLDHWLLSPALPARGVRMLPVKKDAGLIAALVFRALCRQHGITLPAPQRGTVPEAAQLMHTHWSASLASIVTGVLRYSNNMSAELIGQVAARTLRGRPLSLRASAGALARWYRHKLPDTDWSGFLHTNHSGLSSDSRYTPRQMAAILRYGWILSSKKNDGFLRVLSPPAWPPEMRSLAERVSAKSGTMNYADGLVGFFTTHSGRQLGFAILLTDFRRRASLDATFDVRIPAAPPDSHGWTKRAKKLERALVSDWLARY